MVKLKVKAPLPLEMYVELSSHQPYLTGTVVVMSTSAGEYAAILLTPKMCIIIFLTKNNYICNLITNQSDETGFVEEYLTVTTSSLEINNGETSSIEYSPVTAST